MKTIIIVHDQELIISVWSVNIKNFKFDQAYKKFMLSKYEEQGYTDLSKLTADDQKVISGINRTWDRERYIKEKLKGIQLNFDETSF